ncbi:hypothetical protein DOY81_011097 [Sarcophaga bullata]|nr:hypothetical protein DOY81_011097 [Sarcophaga bullata]
MGCDGGTIPRRDELVRLKRSPSRKIKMPNNVIEQLLEKDKMPEAVKHIRSMKDIKQLTLTPNPAFTEEDKTEGLLDSRHAPYICKLIGLEMSGKFRFVALWSCGCVMSERALKEIKGKAPGNCPLCQKEFSIEDVIVLNACDEDLELMKVKMEMREAKKKANKKEKKDKKSKDGKQQNGVKEEETINGKSETCTASTTKPKIVANLKRLGATTGVLEDPDLKRLKTDYSVAKDPKASDVYKSLFTSHKSEKEQTRAHWVTYNPFYN